jgi:hypothetical protein
MAERLSSQLKRKVLAIDQNVDLAPHRGCKKGIRTQISKTSRAPEVCIAGALSVRESLERRADDLDRRSARIEWPP